MQEVNKNSVITCFIALLLIAIGGSMMTISVLIVLSKIDNFFNENFFPLYSMVYYRVFSCVITAFVLIMGVIMLIFGICSDKVSRKNVYRGDSCFIGGKSSAFLLMAVNLITIIIWICTLGALVIPTLIWLMLKSTCAHEVFNKFNSSINYVFNLTSYGIYEKIYLYDISLGYKEALSSSTSLLKLCNTNQDYGYLWLIAVIGSILVVYGLSIFAGILSTTYARLKFTTEIQQYRTVVDLQRNKYASHIEPDSDYQ